MTAADSPDETKRARPRLVLLTNLIAPYRLPVFQALGEVFELSILTGGDEANRAGWKGIERALEGIELKRSRGWTIPFRKRSERGAPRDQRYLQITPGYFFDLLARRPDATITTEMGVRTVIALTYGALFRRPVWIWWGGTRHTERFIGRHRRALRWLLARQGKRWISYGETSTEYLSDLSIARERIVQIQNCVDERIYTADAEPLRKLEPRPGFLCVGRLIACKGIDTLLLAAASLQREGHVFSLLIVGSGPDRGLFEESARKLGLVNVEFLGEQPPASMPRVYRSGDFLVFPTLDEVWGLVVNEALLSGVPVLSSVYAGCAKEILPEENLFDATSAVDLANAMKRALSGGISPPDSTRLKTSAEVARTLANDILGVLKSRKRA
jgi:glycosyltransferase involved in cell wall biosynthesis